MTFWRPNGLRQPNVLLHATHGPYGLAGKGFSHTDIRTLNISNALSFLLPFLKEKTAFLLAAHTQVKLFLKFYDVHQSAFPLLTRIYL